MVRLIGKAEKIAVFTTNPDFSEIVPVNAEFSLPKCPEIWVRFSIARHLRPGFERIRGDLAPVSERFFRPRATCAGKKIVNDNCAPH